MNVLQALFGQSASEMQPLLRFVPPTQAPVSQLPIGQSASEQQVAPVSEQRPVSFRQVPPGQEPARTLPQPPPPAQFAPGAEPPAHRIGIRSPSRKNPKLSGTLNAVIAPVEQSAVPVSSAVIVLMTQVLVAAPAWDRFGIGSGGPKRHP